MGRRRGRRQAHHHQHQDADGEEEDSLAFDPSFRTTTTEAVADVPSFTAWLEQSDPRPRVSELWNAGVAHHGSIEPVLARLEELVASDVTARVVMLLTRLIACYGKSADGEICLDLNVTQQELADMVGATRQTVSSTLSMLKRSGVIHLKNRRICIPSEALLVSMATGVRG